MRQWYQHSRSCTLDVRCQAYYAPASHKKASKLVRHATQCLTQKARFEHARYSLKEPKREVQELYVKNMKQSIARDRGLVRIC